MITVYAATRPKEVDRVVDLVCREIRQIGVKGVEQKELERAKTQMKGSLMLSLESSHSRMSKLAKDETHIRKACIAGRHAGSYRSCECGAGLQCGPPIFLAGLLAITGLGPLASRSTVQAYR